MRLEGGLVFKAHRRVYHPRLESNDKEEEEVIKVIATAPHPSRRPPVMQPYLL